MRRGTQRRRKEGAAAPRDEGRGGQTATAPAVTAMAKASAGKRTRGGEAQGEARRGHGETTLRAKGDLRRGSGAPLADASHGRPPLYGSRRPRAARPPSPAPVQLSALARPSRPPRRRSLRPTPPSFSHSSRASAVGITTRFPLPKN